MRQQPLNYWNLGPSTSKQIALTAVTRRASPPCFDYPDVFAQLYANPITTHNLKRLNWKHLRPRLNVEISLNPQSCLVLDVFPWEEASTEGQEPQGRGYQDIGDFNYFFPRGAQGQTPPNQVMCLPLERSFIATFSPSGDVGLRKTDDHQATARKMCAVLVEAKLHQLSLCFECRFLTRLVCYGPQNFLEIRTTAPLGSDDAPALPDYLATTPNVGTDTQLLHLCEKYQVTPQTLADFAHRYWIPQVPAALRRQTLAQYLGESQEHVVSEDVVTRLLQVCQPTAKLAEHLLHLEDDHDALFQFLSSRGGAWSEKFQIDFALEANAAFDWIFLNHPLIFDEMDVSGAYLREKLEMRVPTNEVNFEHRSYLQSKLIAAWERAFRTGPPDTYLQRLADAAQELSFKTFNDLQQWARKHAFPLLGHLVDSHEAVARELAEAAPKESVLQ